MADNGYDNPLTSRYASTSMIELFGARRRIGIWRRLWIALAEAQQELGLSITDAQLDQLRSQVDNIDFKAAAAHERRLRHDVMAHVHTFGDLCPSARAIIHWGATSAYVTDNADLILLREALQLVRNRLVTVIDRLGQFAAAHRDLACLGFTHMQPAQPTTIGKRATLWAYDLVMDLDQVEQRLQGLRARSTKGTTGTQASFLKLFDGNSEKVLQLEQLVAKKIGFAGTYAVTGQTYPRKVDVQIVDTLSGIAQSAHKAATDVRLLAARKEMEEPFESSQVGSSAMAYKRNPMRCERICSLSRYVMSLQTSAGNTAANQWMERTLDDSANRRLVLPEIFLAVDAVLVLSQNVSSGLIVYPQVIARNLNMELPFMVTENILMAAVASGGDRQELHQKIRDHSQQAAELIKHEGRPNDLMDRLRQDTAFADVDLDAELDASGLIGLAPVQVDDFLKNLVDPIRKKYPDALDSDGSVSV